MRASTVLLIAATLPLAGCLDLNALEEELLRCLAAESDAAQEMLSSMRVHPREPGFVDDRLPADAGFDDFHRIWTSPDPRQDWDDLVVVSRRSNLTSIDSPPGWDASLEELSTLGGNESVYRARLHPTRPGPQDLAWSFHVEHPVSDPTTCGPVVRLEMKQSLLAPAEGAIAQIGDGVLVYTAGFWENGTLFYTNMPAVNESNWPRAGWYAWEGSDPLSVYVYESSRTEKPPYWSPCTPRAPPVEPMCVWNYGTTIEGFNEALKGLSTNSARVVRIPPEKAYTLPGNEGHPLYGDALIFYIRLVEVHELPCTLVGPINTCAIPTS